MKPELPAKEPVPAASVITGLLVAVLKTFSEPPCNSIPQPSSIKSAETVRDVSSKVNVLVPAFQLPDKLVQAGSFTKV